MVKERKKRVAMTKQLKREVFMACLAKVSHGCLPFGTFKVVGEAFGLVPATVSNLWRTTLKLVPGYQSNVLMDPDFILDNVPDSAFDTKFQNAGRKPRFDYDEVLQEIKNIDPEGGRSLRVLAVATGISKTTICRMKKMKKGKELQNEQA
jgi:hypothetical protein